MALPPELIAVLRAHRRAQARERLAAVNVWEDHHLVWCQENGLADSRADWQEWADILVAAGIEHAGTHAMRHSAATIAIHQGVALPVVQEMLGHSDIRVTRDYVDVSSPLAQDHGAADLCRCGCACKKQPWAIPLYPAPGGLMHPLSNAVYGVERSVNIKRRSKSRSPVDHHGTCSENHRSQEAAAKPTRHVA